VHWQRNAQPCEYQNDACPLWHGSPGCVTFTQPFPTALAEQPSVCMSQPTSA